MQKTFITFLYLLFLTKAGAQTDTVPSFIKDSIDTYVNRALKEWNIPGVAV